MKSVRMRTACSLLLVGVLAEAVGAVQLSKRPAPPSPATVQQCENYGRIAALAASMRDKGISSGHVIDYLIRQSREAPVLPGTTEEGRARLVKRTPSSRQKRVIIKTDCVSVAWYPRTASRLQPPEAGVNLPSPPLA